MKILKFENKFIQKSYLTVSILGKSYKLNIKYVSSNIVELVKQDNFFDLYLPKKYLKTDNIEIINQVIQKLYSEIAPKEIENSLELVRHILKFAPEDYRIERLQNEYYKTAKNKVLIINPDIVQYSKEVINTTLIQAFCKLKYRVNSNSYKTNLMNYMQRYEEYMLQLEENAVDFNVVG